MIDQLVDEIKQDIQKHKVMIYMKGTPEMPMCGFSKAAVDVIRSYGVDFGARNILENPDAWRQALHQISQWPTIPQIFIHGKFIGGSDIIRQMHESGELKSLLEGEKEVST